MRRCGCVDVTGGANIAEHAAADWPGFVLVRSLAESASLQVDGGVSLNV